MSYSAAVKFQYWGLGMATGVLIACLVAGALIVHSGGKTCSGELVRPQKDLYCITNLGNIQEDDVK